MENLVLATVFSTVVDKNGQAMRCGKTTDYIDGAGVMHLGAIITTYTEALFDKFIVGLEIAHSA